MGQDGTFGVGCWASDMRLLLCFSAGNISRTGGLETSGCSGWQDNAAVEFRCRHKDFRDRDGTRRCRIAVTKRQESLPALRSAFEMCSGARFVSPDRSVLGRPHRLPVIERVLSTEAANAGDRCPALLEGAEVATGVAAAEHATAVFSAPAVGIGMRRRDQKWDECQSD